MLRVFISSPSGSLLSYRQAAIDVCHRQEITPIYMESFLADAMPPIAVCRAKVETCNILVLLLADRYGAHPPGEKLSYTELEYRWAIELGIPVLPFVAGKNFPRARPPNDPSELDDYLADNKSNDLFIADVRSRHTVKEFADLGDFRLDLYQSLEPYKPKSPDIKASSDFARDLKQPFVGKRRSLPSPPSLCAMPSYDGGAPFTGRYEELRMLDQWAQSDSPVMLVEAIGGTGKSALTWEWTTSRAESSIDDLAGRFWWSFYDGSPSMVRFLRELLGYVTNVSSSEIGQLRPSELSSRALNELQTRPYLVVLDGIERLLVAYDRYDPSEVTDDDVDEGRRLNRHTMIDSTGHEFVRRLADPTSPSKVLITTRTTPDALKRPWGGLRSGVVQMRLPGLTNRDTKSLLRALAVVGNEGDIERFFAPLHNHPLLITIIASLVRDYRPAPGDFADWVKHSGFKLGGFTLTERRNHILAVALDGLDPQTARLLGRLSVLPAPGEWRIVRDINPHLDTPKITKILAEGRLDASLRDLEGRGLLWWNRKSNTYDMHPIVRGFAHDRFARGKRVSAKLLTRDHFRASPPAIIDEASSVEDLEEMTMLFRALTGTQHDGEAESLWVRELADPLLIKLGANSLVVELLQPHWASYVTTLPADLSIALHLAGRHNEGASVEIGSLKYLLKTPGQPVVREVRASLARLTTHLRSMGELAKCAKATALLAQLVNSSFFSDDYGAQCDLILRQAVEFILSGDYVAAANQLQRVASVQTLRNNPWFSGDVTYWGLALKFWSGSNLTIREFEQAEQQFPHWRSKLRLRGLLFDQLMATARFSNALSVAIDIDRLRRIGGHDVGPAESARALAALGRLDEATAALQECTLRIARIHAFDIPHYSIALALHRLGRHEEAVAHATLAHRQAWASGPPFCHKPNLVRSEALLRGLKIEPQHLPSVTLRQTSIPLQEEIQRLCDAVSIQTRTGYPRPSSNSRSTLFDPQAEREMRLGTVKFFNGKKGYGYISVDGGGDDVFVHYSNIDDGGFHELGQGQLVELYVAPGRRGEEAQGVRRTTTRVVV